MYHLLIGHKWSNDAIVYSVVIEGACSFYVLMIIACFVCKHEHVDMHYQVHCQINSQLHWTPSCVCMNDFHLSDVSFI